MSVLAPSPLHAKRHYEDEATDSFERGAHCSVAKRARGQVHSSSPARCGPSLTAPGLGSLYALPASTAAALRSLFPEMDEQIVATVLTDCGNNIDAAIKRLGELRLTGAAARAAENGVSPAPAVREDLAAGPSLTSERPAAAAASGEQSTSGSLEPQGPETAEQWVDFIVGEMATAKDIQDAKGKAAGCLQRFEGFVSSRITKQQDAKTAKMAEENGVLKKAVQIQHRQLQERAGLEGENAQLKQLLAQYQEQLRTLEVNNYSLAMHLQKATNAGMMQHRNPDVF